MRCERERKPEREPTRDPDLRCEPERMMDRLCDAREARRERDFEVWTEWYFDPDFEREPDMDRTFERLMEARDLRLDFDALALRKADPLRDPDPSLDPDRDREMANVSPMRARSSPSSATTIPVPKSI